MTYSAKNTHIGISQPVSQAASQAALAAAACASASDISSSSNLTRPSQQSSVSNNALKFNRGKSATRRPPVSPRKPCVMIPPRGGNSAMDQPALSPNDRPKQNSPSTKSPYQLPLQQHHHPVSKNSQESNHVPKNLWNDLNNSSSSTAMAAASSIAKTNPSSLISNDTSPRLIKKTNSLQAATMGRTSLRQSEQPTVAKSNSITSETHSTLSKQLPRKPPPPPRNLPTSENVNCSVGSTASISSKPGLDQHPLPDTSMNITYSKMESAASSPKLTNSGFSYNHEVAPIQANPVYHKRTLSKSQKISNFFVPKSSRDDKYTYNNQQYTNSASILPSQIGQLNINDSTTSLTQEHDLASLAGGPYSQPPSIYQSRLDMEDEFTENREANATLTPATNQLYTQNNNSSSANIYNKTANIPIQQLVFRTTLRDDDKRGGFGRNKKSKAEFNEDKPWKNHTRVNLNMVTAEEKKRYEGVFAANKSAYLNLDSRLVKKEPTSLQMSNSLSSTSENALTSEKSLNEFVNTYSSLDQRIHGLVVRDIWMRSKLDENTLARIWSLVLDDRKRRWIRLISTGDTIWLLNGLQDESDVDNEPADKPAEENGQYSKTEDDSFSYSPADTSDVVFKPSFTFQEESEEKINLNMPANMNETLPTSTSAKEELGVTSSARDNIFQLPQHKFQSKVKLDIPRSPNVKRRSGCGGDLLNINRDLFDDGTLTCDEFIVGMWLIDQCLYGRKMPKMIPLTVWETIGVDWTLSAGINSSTNAQSGYNDYYNHHYHGVPVISNVTDIMGMGIKKGKQTGKKASKRGVLKKVMGKI